MTGVSSFDRVKLARVLGMLGSDHPGERDAAGQAAMRIVRDAGLTWGDVLLPAPPAPGYFPSSSTGRWHPDTRSRVEDDLGLCLRNLHLLSAWEESFCLSLATKPHPTPRQLGKLLEIAQQLRSRSVG